MASEKITLQKIDKVKEIIDNFKKSKSVVFFNYSGLNVADMTELRKRMRNNDADLKVYKNTLTKRALAELKYDLEEHLQGPKAVAYGNDAVIPVKLLAEFKKVNSSLQIVTGIVEGKTVQIDVLNQLANLPSREGLITMIAGGLLGHIRDFAICIDLHRQNIEN